MPLKVSIFVLVVGTTLTITAHANCWVEAGERYGINPNLLWAIAGAESDFNPRAHNLSHLKRTGTRDIGLMQINSSALPKLKGFGIDEDKLWIPCNNIHVGAWILAEKMKKLGPTWDAVGAYNAACTTLTKEGCIKARSKYTWRVYKKAAGVDSRTMHSVRIPKQAHLLPEPRNEVATIQTISFNTTPNHLESNEK